MRIANTKSSKGKVQIDLDSANNWIIDLQSNLDESI